MACLAAVALGTQVAQGVSTFRLFALAAALVLLPVAAFYPDLIAALFLAGLWARGSDVGIADQGLPSLVVPSAVALVGLILGRRLLAGERVDATTFRGLFPMLPYMAVVGLSVLWATAPERSEGGAADLAKNLLIFWVL